MLRSVRIRSLKDTSLRLGTPVMRPVFYDFPADQESWNVEDAYLFGPDLYVAPVMEDHVTEREVYLPDGTAWFNP